MRRLAVLLVAAVLAVPAVAAAFANTEPYAAKQWYLEQDNAWTFWAAEPQLYPIRVAVIDSGIDGSHPDLKGRVVAAKSFVGGSPYVDTDGHGTFVAGEIAANPNNMIGIAGLAFNAQLVVAKVVDASGDIPLPAEVAAIKWAVAQGARVINLSVGGLRDPLNPSIDSYSALEQAAIETAYASGVVVVASVGNGPPHAPHVPWSYADYPAALPHVIGVSAVRRDRSVPDYSNRDAVYNDLAAPGDGMFSTIPTNLVAVDSGCTEPYSDCGPLELRNAIGTSFDAPQVSAAAALLLGVQPRLRPEQVSWLIERSADDDTPATGCPDCTDGRDAVSGWGTLNIAKALTMLTNGTVLPPPDHYEPNDDAGPWAHALPPLPKTITATLDYWDDNIDVYRVTLKKGQRLYARLTPDTAATVGLSLWAPGTQRVASLDLTNVRVSRSTRRGTQARLAYKARVSGTYYLEAKLVSQTRDPVQYRLALSRRSV